MLYGSLPSPGATLRHYTRAIHRRTSQSVRQVKCIERWCRCPMGTMKASTVRVSLKRERSLVGQLARDILCIVGNKSCSQPFMVQRRFWHRIPYLHVVKSNGISKVDKGCLGELPRVGARAGTQLPRLLVFDVHERR